MPAYLTTAILNLSDSWETTLSKYDNQGSAISCSPCLTSPQQWWPFWAHNQESISSATHCMELYCPSSQGLIKLIQTVNSPEKKLDFHMPVKSSHYVVSTNSNQEYCEAWFN